MAVDMSAVRHAIELISHTLGWLLKPDGRLEQIHPGLRGTLTAARSQIDSALKLVGEEES